MRFLGFRVDWKFQDKILGITEGVWEVRKSGGRERERRGCFLLKIEFLRENKGFENLATDRTVERGLGKRLGGFGF